ncbi:MAG: transglutaminase-like domain-containing protein [Bacteroidales bacterium]|nr:transglutaminase-like domain-containing protein [Bacteroidales bacterium]
MMPAKDSAKELNALVSMIDEPSEEIFATIREKITGYGKVAIPLLEDAWMNSFSDEQTQRLEGLIGDIRFNDVYHELYDWKQSKQQDLLEAFVLITRFRYPGFDAEKYLEQMERLKKDAWLEMNDELTALEKIKVLNHIFYDVYGFRSVPDSRKSKLNSYFLNELLDTKKGNALSLGILYAYVAQSLNIPVFGVNLPQHFILTYLDDSLPVKTSGHYNRDDVLFYINAMNKGAIFTANEVSLFIRKLKMESRDEYFLPCSKLTFIGRLIMELEFAYKEAGDTARSEEMGALFNVLG